MCPERIDVALDDPAASLRTRLRPRRALHLGERQNVENDRIGNKKKRYQAGWIKQHLIGLIKGEQLQRGRRTGKSKEERADEIGYSDGENEFNTTIRDFLVSVAD